MKENVVIENIVVSLNLYQNIPLAKLSKKFLEVEYEPEIFPGAILKFINPKCTALLFQNGKIICTGNKSLEDVEKVKKKVFSVLKKVGVEVKKYDEEIVNVVASLELGFEVDLERLAFDLENCEFEPEQFPGLIYRKEQPKIIFLVFRSGRIISTGTKDVKIAKEELKNFAEKVKEYKLQ